MRITVTIDDDVLAAAQALAERNGGSLGAAVWSMLNARTACGQHRPKLENARRGIRATGAVGDDDGIPAFRVAADAAPITSGDFVQSAQRLATTALREANVSRIEE